jgi:hypothetical protein
VGTKKGRQNPIETAELPQKDTKNQRPLTGILMAGKLNASIRDSPETNSPLIY